MLFRLQSRVRGAPTRLAALLLIGFAGLAQAQTPAPDDGGEERWSLHGQGTWVWQHQSAFRSPYVGANSLQGASARSYSFTATANLATRLWPGGEAYFDAEAAQGVPLSNLTGLGGFTNGELARTSGPRLTLYRARLFIRHTIGFGGGSDAVEGEAHQLAGRQDRRRLVITAGNLAVGDVFDDNDLAHDPRTRFLNWALMAQGAYDYAADARGYSRGLALEWYDGDWALRWGRFLQPVEPNGQQLDPHIGRHFGDQIELERGWTLADDRPGRARLLLYRNRARMASFQAALDAVAGTPATPSLDAVRGGERDKRGWGLNLQQALSADLSAFARVGASDGRTETYAFTEIDRSMSLGAVIAGSSWGRAADSVGLAMARHGLSATHRAYLAAGGQGFFLGDGRLNYRPEQVIEVFYSWALRKQAWLTFDLQRIRNPGYNADRGPVPVGSVRLHAEF
jgi:hypothetical protein